MTKYISCHDTDALRANLFGKAAFLSAPYWSASPATRAMRANLSAALAAALLLDIHCQCYSPVAHGHALANTGPARANSKSDGYRAQEAVFAAHSMMMLEMMPMFLFCELPGFRGSLGMRTEMRAAQQMKKEILILTECEGLYRGPAL